jgi:heptosyltransferase-1
LNSNGLQLVANVPKEKTSEFRSFSHIRVHTSSLNGLIHATRQATAVVGVDSGPLHLAAALRKPGVGVYGPTDPALTGPFGGSIVVLRTPKVETTYKRHRENHASMLEITPEQVASALLDSLRQPAAAPHLSSLVSHS